MAARGPEEAEAKKEIVTWDEKELSNIYDSFKNTDFQNWSSYQAEVYLHWISFKYLREEKIDAKDIKYIEELRRKYPSQWWFEFFDSYGNAGKVSERFRCCWQAANQGWFCAFERLLNLRGIKEAEREELKNEYVTQGYTISDKETGRVTEFYSTLLVQEHGDSGLDSPPLCEGDHVLPCDHVHVSSSSCDLHQHRGVSSSSSSQRLPSGEISPSSKRWNKKTRASVFMAGVGIVSAIVLTVLNFGDALKLYHLSFADAFAKIGINGMSGLTAILTTAGIGLAGIFNAAAAAIFVTANDKDKKEDNAKDLQENVGWIAALKRGGLYFITIFGSLLGTVPAVVGVFLLSPISLAAMGFAIMPFFGWIEVYSKPRLPSYVTVKVKEGDSTDRHKRQVIHSCEARLTRGVEEGVISPLRGSGHPATFHSAAIQESSRAGYSSVIPGGDLSPTRDLNQHQRGSQHRRSYFM